MLSSLFTLVLATTAVQALPHLFSGAARPSPALDEFLAETSDLEIRATNATSALPDATVTLCTEPNFKGDCAVSKWQVNECIDLRDYAGLVHSFLPASGFDCLLMQNECDATTAYADIGAKDTTEGSDLTKLEWIADSTSYICFTEIAALQRFVRISRLRVAGASNVAVNAS